MEANILDKIKSYQTIIIHRHHHPDLDAYGSQLGLKNVILKNYPKKLVYAVGDSSHYFTDATMDVIADEIYHDALVIIVDTAVAHLISDDRYKLAKEVIVIDHHLNESDINPSLFYSKSDLVSAAEIIVDLIKAWNFKMDSVVATHLLAGMIGDSGRYMYINQKNAQHVFEMSAFVSRFEPNIQQIYDFLFVEPLARRLGKNKFSNFELTKNQVAYQINDLNKVKESGFDFMTVSRGMLGAMAGIKEVIIWASFTETDDQKILGELRSRFVDIVDIARKYGGGGHANACGCTLTSWEEVYKVINDLDERGSIYERSKTNI